MISTNTWLKIICGMQVNAILFGTGAIGVLVNPALAENAKVWLTAVVVLSFALSPFIAARIAPRLRLRHWQERGLSGDAISG